MVICWYESIPDNKLKGEKKMKRKFNPKKCISLALCMSVLLSLFVMPVGVSAAGEYVTPDENAVKSMMRKS